MTISLMGERWKAGEGEALEVVPLPAAEAGRALVEQLIGPATDPARELVLRRGDALVIEVGFELAPLDFEGLGFDGDLVPRRCRFAPLPGDQRKAQGGNQNDVGLTISRGSTMRSNSAALTAPSCSAASLSVRS